MNVLAGSLTAAALLNGRRGIDALPSFQRFNV